MLRLVKTTTTFPLVRNLSLLVSAVDMEVVCVSIPFPAQPIIAHFAEELSVALHSSVRTHGQHTSAISCK